MSANRLHTAGQVAGVTVDIIASWPDGAATADIEEAVKAAARDAIRAARDRTANRP